MNVSFVPSVAGVVPGSREELIRMCELPSQTILRLWLALLAVYFLVVFMHWLLNLYSGKEFSAEVLHWIRDRADGLLDVCLFVLSFIALWIFWVKGDFRGDFYTFFLFLGFLLFFAVGVWLVEKLQKKTL